MVDEIVEFGRDEFAHRLERLRGVMRERGVSVMLIDEVEALAYFTGYERSISLYRACLIPLEGDPVMIIRSLDIAPFVERAWFKNYVAFSDHEDPVGVIAATVQRLGYGSARIGVDFRSHAMTVSTYAALLAALPSVSFVDMSGVPWELRLTKSIAEIAYLQRAACIADQTLAEIAERVVPGASERSVSAYAARRYIELGAVPGHVGPITKGRGWNFLHGHLHDTPLSDGDTLHIELVPRYRGYSARLMRSIVLGPASPEQIETAETLIALQDEQIAAMRPGVAARDVDAIVRHGALRARLRQSYENITGYTLGYYSQHSVRSSDFTRAFSETSDWCLEHGMVFHMYASAKGLAISETVVVEAQGARRLTRLPRKLYQTGKR